MRWRRAEAIETGGERRVSASPLTMRACVGWGLGSVGMMTLLNLTNTLILKYVVDFLGFSAAVAGGLIAATRIFDALIDPAMGMLSDNTRSRWGRRRPYLLAGGLLCALMPVLLFVLPTMVGAADRWPMVVAALLFFGVAHTVFNVPYMAMPVEMTDDPHERSFLFSFRIYGTAIGGLIGGAAAPWLVSRFGGDIAAFASMAWFMSGVILVCCLAAFLLTYETGRFAVVHAGRRPGLSALATLTKNRPFLLLLLAKVLIVAGTGVGAAAMAFFITRILDEDLSWLGFFIGLTTAGMMLSQTVWLFISRRRGKRRCFLIAAAGYSAVALSWLLAGPEEARLTLGLRSVLLGVFGGGILLTSQAMLPDVMAHEVMLTGIRHEGAMTGVYTTVERGASALGVALAGIILGMGNYVGGTGPLPPGASTAIYACVAIVPALAIAASSIAFYFYDLED
ncbi:MFS transporter [Polymorphobacter sp.]|uniref:MFS transporter n=1 Tax=Polymorphobacter sp. TaxID=1909290 RepID=UPI003F713632